MAKTKDYLDYLDAKVEIAPANSEEELDCAQTIADVFSFHGLDPQVQEFTASSLGSMPHGVMMVLLFVGLVLMGIGGVAAAVGLVLLLVGIVTLVLSYLDVDVLGKLGPRARSQNVYALHRAEGEGNVSRNRPIVVLAHYDTQRLDLLSRAPLSHIKRYLAIVAPVAVVVVAVCTLFQILVFLPEGVRRVFWVIGLIASLPMLVWGICLIAGRFLPYAEGAVDNKSSLAAMFGVLEDVCPTEGEVMPGASELVSSRRAAVDAPIEDRDEPEESASGAEPVRAVRRPAATAQMPVAQAAGQPMVTKTVVRHVQKTKQVVEEVVGARHGEGILRQLSILPTACEISYIAPEVRTIPVADEIVEEIQVPAAPRPQASTAQSEQIGETQPMPASSAVTAPMERVAEDGLGSEDSVAEQSREPLDGEAVSEKWQPSPYAPDASVEPTDENRADGDASARAEADDQQEDADNLYSPGQIELPEGPSFMDKFSQFAASFKTVVVEKSADLVDHVKGAIEDGRAALEARREQASASEEEDFEEGNETSEGGEDVAEEDSVVSASVPAEGDVADVDVRTDDSEVSVGDDEPLSGDVAADGYAAAEELRVDGEAMPEPAEEDGGVAEKDARQTAAWERTPSPSETGGIPPFIASSTGSFAPVTSEKHVEQTGAATAASVVPVGDIDEAASPEPVVIEADGDFSPEPDAAGVAADFSPEPIEQSAPAVVPAVIEDDRTVAPAPARTVTDDITVLPVAATPANTSSEQATAQFPSLTQLENGQSTDEGPLVETDHSGLRTMVDDDADATMPIKQKEPRPAPAVIDDPNWGKSSYRPTAARVVRASAASTAAIPVADVNASPTSVSPDVARDVAPADVVTPAAAGSPSRRASLFDLPDPLAATGDALAPSAARGESEATAPMRRVHVDDASSVDGVAAAGSPAGRGVRSAPMPVRIDDSGVRPVLVPPTGNAKPAGDIEVLRHAPLADEQPKPKRHRGLFGRKKAQQSDSMSEWLGVDEDFNAKESGESIGSWDHFDDDERAPRGGHWKGGAARSAASRTDADADVGDEDLRDAILSMDDEALRSHDIWFVATGASSLGHAGIKEFVEQNRKLLRGAFVINLECVGAGAPTLLTQEGFTTKRRGDRRLISLLSSVAADLHVGFDKMPRAWADTEATPLMRRSLRAVTIMGMGESQLPAFSRTDGDIPENVVESQVADINAIITEAIRRS